VENRQNVDVFFVYYVDNAVTAKDDLADIISADFRHNTPRPREHFKTLDGFD